jgi:hypothetical protein
VVIDGQVNQDPITSYAPPYVSALVLDSGATPVGANGIPTDGGVAITVLGRNFGPPSASPLALVQWVRVVSVTQELAVSSFTVVNHTAIRVVMGPGVGRSLSVSVRAADQLSSTATSAVLDYLPPVVVSLTPSTGPTSGAGTLVLVSGHNFGLSADATVSVLLGNPEDNSVSARLPAQPVFPPGDDGKPKIRAIETVRFTLPPGAASLRAVRVLVYPGSLLAQAATSNPLSDGAGAMFSYLPPTVSAVFSALVVNNASEIAEAQSRLGPVGASPPCFRVAAYLLVSRPK